MIPTGSWQYNFTSEDNLSNNNKISRWFQSVHYLEVSLYTVYIHMGHKK